jgi:hypothetical protein
LTACTAQAWFAELFVDGDGAGDSAEKPDRPSRPLRAGQAQQNGARHHTRSESRAPPKFDESVGAFFASHRATPLMATTVACLSFFDTPTVVSRKWAKWKKIENRLFASLKSPAHPTGFRHAGARRNQAGRFMNRRRRPGRRPIILQLRPLGE